MTLTEDTLIKVGIFDETILTPFDSHDLGQLHAHRTQLPGAAADTPMIAVARSGCTVDDVVHLGPEDLIKAYA